MDPMTVADLDDKHGGKATDAVLIAGVGYSYLKDLSFGPVLVKKMQSLHWPEHVEIEDLSYGPVSVIHKLNEKRYRKIVLIGAVQRGRKAGSIRRYHPDGNLPDEEEIRVRMEEAVAGVISLDNLLILCRYYKAFPEDVVVIEVEAEDDSWGEGFSPLVRQAMDRVIQMTREETGIQTGNQEVKN